MKKIRIGWAGLGNMGVPMMKTLARAGYEIVLFNRTAAKAEALGKELQLSVAATPAGLLKDTSFVISMLADDTALKEVYTGPGGILTGKPAKEIIAIDMSTVSPATTQQLAALCREKGMSYLDAPVSGSVKQAEEKQLVIMVGGDTAVYEKARPVFDNLGKASFLAGKNGAGNYTKLAVNLFLGITAQGLAEAALFAGKNGIDAATLFSIINNGALGSAFSKLKSSNIIENNFKAAFALKHEAKDLRLAKEEGMNTPLGNEVNKSFQKALENGLGEEDIIAIMKFINSTQ